MVGAAAALPAEAAPGDPVLQGSDNNAVNATTLRSSSNTATLRLANGKVITEPNGRVLTAPTLRLTPNGEGLSSSAEVGSIGLDTAGNIWAATGRYEEYGKVDRVHTSTNSNRIVPVIPQRVLDTRTAQGRVNIYEPDNPDAPVNLDSAGRLLGGHTIEINLARYVYISEATFGTVTAVGSLAAGFLQIFPGGLPRPTTFATLNFETGRTMSNGFMSGVNWSTDRISVYAQRTTHVVIDVVAFVIGFGQVYPQILLPNDDWLPLKPDRAAVARQRRPSWEQGN
ncbi:hypothetical protein GCM10027614_49340 [Micromonospora vulcania]